MASILQGVGVNGNSDLACPVLRSSVVVELTAEGLGSTESSSGRFVFLIPDLYLLRLSLDFVFEFHDSFFSCASRRECVHRVILIYDSLGQETALPKRLHNSGRINDA